MKKLFIPLIIILIGLFIISKNTTGNTSNKLSPGYTHPDWKNIPEESRTIRRKLIYVQALQDKYHIQPNYQAAPEIKIIYYDPIKKSIQTLHIKDEDIKTIERDQEPEWSSSKVIQFLKEDKEFYTKRLR